PRERIEPSADGETALRDRLLRAVLERWDYREPDGWRTPLQQALEAQPGAEQARHLRRELGALLSRFAGSDTRRQLAAGRACERDVEFALPVPRGEGEGTAWVRGVIDCLWQDGAGDWHLLAYDTGPARQENGGNGRELGLVLGACAVEQQLGTR